MLFMAKIVLHLPGDWSKEKLQEMNLTERARSMQFVKDGVLKRIYRIVGLRGNFSIWEAETLEELHETLTSLPLHPYMDIEIYPLIRHTTTEAWEAEFGAMPEF
jgi:muconolactone D-isomerase